MKAKTEEIKSPTSTDLIADALNEPVSLDVDEVAKGLGLSVPNLLDRLQEKLNDNQVQRLDVIPQIEPYLGAIAAIRSDLETQRSVRPLEASQVSVVGELPQAANNSPTTEIPVLEEEAPKKRRGRPKKEVTALTKKKSESLKESDQKSQQMAASDQEIKVALHAQKGQKSGAQLATIELAAEDATYRNIKGQALVRKVAQLSSELASDSSFDPIQVLKDLGIDSNSEILEDLRQQVEPTLGKLQSATAEIVDSAWVNGIHLETEFGALENLMNSNGSTSDYWQ